MPGIDPKVMTHRLNVNPVAKSVKQKKWLMAQEKIDFVNKEVEKFLAGFIHEVNYPQWVSNVVVVPKAGGKLRMCIDFMDLNKACPKDCFPLFD